MEKFSLEGYIFCDFGTNNYSNGMRLITSTDRPQEILEKVKSKAPAFYNVWLNPSAPCQEDEFFGFLGTKEQYEKTYKEQVDSQIAAAMVAKFGWNNWPDREITDAYEAELRKNYKDWWEK
jgi:hypothetical protein